MFEWIDGQSALGSGCGVTKPVSHIGMSSFVQGDSQDQRAKPSQSNKGVCCEYIHMVIIDVWMNLVRR